MAASPGAQPGFRGRGHSPSQRFLAAAVSVVWPGKGQELQGRREFQAGVPPLTSEPGRKLYGPEEEKRGWWWSGVTEEQTGGSRTVQTVENGISVAYRSRLGLASPEATVGEAGRSGPEAPGAFHFSVPRGCAQAPALGLPLEAQALSPSTFPPSFPWAMPPPPRSSPLSVSRVHLAPPSSPWHDSSPG